MLPNGWEEVALSEICRKQISYGIVQTGELENEGIPCVRVVDLTKKTISVEEMITTSEKINRAYRKTILEKGEIMIALRGEVGLARIVKTNLIGSNLTRGVARISVKAETADPMYLLWAIRSESFRSDLIRRVGGSALQEIALGELRKVRTLIPPLPEQKKIAKILSTWDKAITITEQLIANSQQQKKALMQQLLTGKKRLAGFSGEWEEVSVSEFGKVVTGNTPPKVDNSNYGSSVCWATAPDFKGKYIENTGVKLSKEGAKKARVLPAGSVLVTCIASIGKNAIASVDMATNQQINSVIVGENHSNEFFFYIVGYYNKKLIAWAGTTAVPILNKSSFEKIKFLTPSKQEQQKIAQVLSSADQEIETLQQKLNFLKEEKKALMQQLLTGKRRVQLTKKEIKMSRGKNQHVVKHPDGWAVKGAGNSKATKVTNTQQEAIDVAEDIARNQHSDTKVHGRNGKIRAGNSYGNDPHPPKDKK